MMMKNQKKHLKLGFIYSGNRSIYVNREYGNTRTNPEPYQYQIKFYNFC